jgi:hypothetical protein
MQDGEVEEKGFGQMLSKREEAGSSNSAFKHDWRGSKPEGPEHLQSRDGGLVPGMCGSACVCVCVAFRLF